MIPLYKALIRPIIEYANPVWAPYLRKYIDLIENVQHFFTRCVIGMRNLDYESRLRALRLPSLEFRRVRGDLIEVYKICHKIYDPITTKSLLTFADSNTRAHKYKLTKPRFCPCLFLSQYRVESQIMPTIIIIHSSKYSVLFRFISSRCTWIRYSDVQYFPIHVLSM